MSNEKHLVWLTRAELVHLDGLCSPEVQAKVDVVKAALASVQTGLTENEGALVAEIVSEARTNGQLVYETVWIPYCSVCRTDAGKVTHGKNGRLLKNPTQKHMPAVNFARRFLVFRNRVTLGACAECVKKLLPTIAHKLRDVRAEIPQAVLGRAPEWKRWDNAKCTVCGWTGHEGQLGKLPAIMGGTYFGECPACKARNELFGRRNVETSGHGFTIERAS